MATAASQVGSNRVKRHKFNLVVHHGGKELPAAQGSALLLDISVKINARRLQRRVERATRRNEGFPERQSVAIAMLAVEEHIVKALWTIARQPLGKAGPVLIGRCGIDYLHDRSDIHSIYADSPGGKWDSVAPRPALPSSKEITAADRVQDWLLLIDDENLRKLLVVGATSKRGDAGRQINWIRIRQGMRELDGIAARTLNFKYQEALRVIVSELSLARAG
jgi:hypothetical protein